MNDLDESSCVVCTGKTQETSLLDVETPVTRVQVKEELHLPSGVTVPQNESMCGHEFAVFGTVQTNANGTQLRHPDGSVDVHFHVPDPSSTHAQEIGIQRVPRNMLHSLLVTDHNMLFDDAARVNTPGAVQMLHTQPRTGLVNENCWMHSECLLEFSRSPQQRCPGCRRMFTGRQAGSRHDGDSVDALFDAQGATLTFRQIQTRLSGAMGNDADDTGVAFEEFRNLAAQYPHFWIHRDAQLYRGELLLWAIYRNNIRAVDFMLADPQNVPPGTVMHCLHYMPQFTTTFVLPLNLTRRKRLQEFILRTGIQMLCAAVLLTRVDLERPHLPCIMSTLIAHGASVNGRLQGITPLITAIALAPACDAFHKILFLLRNTAKPALPCVHGYTPLFYALQCFRVDTLMMFVYTGAPGVYDDNTPRTTQSMDIVECLLNAMFPDHLQRALRLSYLSTTACCHIRGEVTPLAIVAPLADPLMLLWLMDAGASVNQLDDCHMHALFEATQSHSTNGMQVLLYNDSDIAQCNTDHQTALTYMLYRQLTHAISDQRARIFGHLPDTSGSQLGMRNVMYRNTWYRNSALQHSKVQLLLAYGIDATKVDVHGHTALSYLHRLCAVDTAGHARGEYQPLIALIQEWSTRPCIQSLPDHTSREPRNRYNRCSLELSEIQSYHSRQIDGICRQ
jgi:hypothetical protein